MSQATALTATNPTRTAMTVLFGVSAAHLLNDAMQNVVPAVFPMFQENLHLSFAQIGWIAFTLNITASILQPLIGYYTDRRPMPMLLPLGMVFTLLGMIGLALSPSLAYLLLSSALIGVGSSVLHPESSRVAHMAAGKGKGFAQSIFQVGGNTGQALAPLMVAYIISPIGQYGFLWFTLLAVIGIVIQAKIGQWYRAKTKEMTRAKARVANASASRFSKGFIAFVLGILVLMLFSKFVYLSSMSGYYSFYFMDKYHLPLERAQLCLFALQFAGMAGTFIGGPLADKIGRQKVIWFSILGTAPFSLLLPYASPLGAVLLCLAIGLILMSGFSVIIVYAQELLPGHVGTIAGLFFGISFGLGGLGSVVMGSLIDTHGVDYMIKLSAFLPLLGLFALLLPKDSVIMSGGKK
ncbi:MFS transporter [Paenibacillus sp. MMS18-CY102]|uniref:MFS transporter n=1 Tax=Paenibacillus sp. MMS18-CY102 TaxID=2682849 RepID=UPI0013655F92|nr:MFS transporter [Paenibacillus sp. MMS18-CY102]MWC29431.1 MFS transporter [Paenibacillus sp. MMS18-CY102]